MLAMPTDRARVSRGPACPIRGDFVTERRRADRLTVRPWVDRSPASAGGAQLTMVFEFALLAALTVDVVVVLKIGPYMNAWFP